MHGATVAQMVEWVVKKKKRRVGSSSVSKDTTTEIVSFEWMLVVVGGAVWLRLLTTHVLHTLH